MLTLAELDRAGYHTVAIATPDTQGRLVGRELPLRRFLDDPDEAWRSRRTPSPTTSSASRCSTAHSLAPTPVTTMSASNQI